MMRLATIDTLKLSKKFIHMLKAICGELHIENNKITQGDITENYIARMSTCC